jgi:hypothetical protein
MQGHQLLLPHMMRQGHPMMQQALLGQQMMRPQLQLPPGELISLSAKTFFPKSETNHFSFCFSFRGQTFFPFIRSKLIIAGWSHKSDEEFFFSLSSSLFFEKKSLVVIV